MKIDYINGKIIYILEPESLQELEKKIEESYQETNPNNDRYSYAYATGYLGSSYTFLREAYNDLKTKVEYLENQLIEK